MNPLKQGPYSPDHCVCEVPDIWVTSLCNQETGAGAGPASGFIVVVLLQDATFKLCRICIS